MDDTAANNAPTEPTYRAIPDRRVKVTHLVFGLVFLGVAGIWALEQSGLVDWTVSRYLAPGVLVGAGVIGLIALAASAGRRNETNGA